MCMCITEHGDCPRSWRYCSWYGLPSPIRPDNFRTVVPFSVLSNGLLCQAPCASVHYRTRGFVRDLGGTALGVVDMPNPAGRFEDSGILLSIDELSAVSSPLCVGILRSMGLCPSRWRYCACCLLPLPSRIFLNCCTLHSTD